MSTLVYADGTVPQLRAALHRILGTKGFPYYLWDVATWWLLGDLDDEADLAAVLWRYVHTKSAPAYLKLAAARWMAPR